MCLVGPTMVVKTLLALPSANMPANHINIPTGDVYEIPVNMSGVTTKKDHDPDLPVLDCDPHNVLLAPEAADATEEHTFHANLLQPVWQVHGYY